MPQTRAGLPSIVAIDARSGEYRWHYQEVPEEDWDYTCTQPMVLAEANPLPGEYDSAFGDEPKGKQTSPYIRKPKYHYSWDWGPRLVNIGLWRPVRLEAWDEARIDGFRVDQEAINDTEARLVARWHGHDGGRVTFAVTPRLFVEYGFANMQHIMQRRQAVLYGKSRLRVARLPRLLQLRAQRRRDVGDDRNAAVRAGCEFQLYADESLFPSMRGG